MSSGRAIAATPLPEEVVLVRPTPDPVRPKVHQARVEVKRHGMSAHLLLLALLALLVLVNVLGLAYYTAPAAARVRSPLHPWLKPSGYVGQTAGAMAFALFLFLWLYPLRKKIRWLAFTGPISKWLDLHVVAGLCIPLLAATHAAWHFTGLIGLGYGAMMIAWLSGIAGRYLYVRIPRTQSGVEMTREQVETERKAIMEHISEVTGIDAELLEHTLSGGVSSSPPADLGVPRAIVRMVADDLQRWRLARSLHWQWRGATKGEEPVDRTVAERIRTLVRREIALSQQVRMLEASHKAFRHWHIAHRPMAISALVAVLAHVVTAVAVGATWLP